MNFSLCRHIKTNGKRCKSPALDRGALCYFHSRLIHRQNSIGNSPSFASMTTNNGIPCYPPGPLELDLPVLEDRESIQVSISLIVAALARNRMDAKRASAILYGLHMASINVRSIMTEPPFADQVVRSVVSSDFNTDFASVDSGPDSLPNPELQDKESPVHSNSFSSPGVIKEEVMEAR